MLLSSGSHNKGATETEACVCDSYKEQCGCGDKDISAAADVCSGEEENK
jgi:hypothetical protein